MVGKIVNDIPVNPNMYECTICNYNTCSKKDFYKHNATLKHSKLQNDSNGSEKNPISPKQYICACGNTYKYDSGYYRHKKKCQKFQGNDNTNITTQITPEIILSVLQQNKELQQLIMEQNKTIIEMSKNSQINNIHHTNSHNKTFNLQVFLNETCKDAMNIKDFIQSLELNLTDLEKVGELGYAEGISRMFIKGLNNLEITKRPIHCSDVKREIMHIKDNNKWEMDNANQDKLKNIIKQLTHKNIMLVDDWKQANPGCTEYNSKKYDHYLKLTMESIGPCDEADEKRDFNKIIRRVAENTAIDKKCMAL